MEASDLEAIRSVLAERRSTIEDELPALDAAISRLDALIESEGRKVLADIDAYHERVQTLRAVREAL